jgi:hypothetical protein
VTGPRGLGGYKSEPAKEGVSVKNAITPDRLEQILDHVLKIKDEIESLIKAAKG